MEKSNWKDAKKIAKKARAKSIYNFIEWRHLLTLGNKATFTEYKKFIEDEKFKMNLQRFKGLGEMNPEELWQTTLNPDNRVLLKVQYSNHTKDKSKKDRDIIHILMGDEVSPRKDFIISRALEVSNLDI